MLKDTLGGVPCNTDALNEYLKDFSASFGPGKQCKYAVGLIESEVTSFLQFQAGDIFLETLSVEVDINFQSGQTGNFTDHQLTLELTLSQVMFSLTTSYGYYNYEVKKFTLQ